MYSKCKDVVTAGVIFERMKRRNAVSWNSMIDGYVESGNPEEAMMIFQKMMEERIQPTNVTVMQALHVSLAELSIPRQAKWIHGLVVRRSLDKNVYVMTALVDMYAKCGAIHTARRLFDRMGTWHVITWNAMIDGYGVHGHGRAAVDLFMDMQKGDINMKPNHITFLCILSAFSHSGLVDEGMRFFDSMKNDYVLEPAMDHYGAVVELLGRAGRLKENLLFPALFVTYSYGVAMLSATLLQKAAQSVHFHPEWEKLSIVHLCFGDDLLEKVAWESVPLSINSIGSLD
ncbi:Pentatricopeptide repeat-containing protein At1g11290, chloroplastic [Linum grandiflorum]